MTHVFIDPNNLNWLGLVAAQEGRGAQQARYFQGMRYQRGNGILGSIGRFLIPIAKNLASAVGEEGLAAGTKALSDISQGKNVKEALLDKGKRKGGRPKGTKSKPTVVQKRRRIDQLTPYF